MLIACLNAGILWPRKTEGRAVKDILNYLKPFTFVIRLDDLINGDFLDCGSEDPSGARSFCDMNHLIIAHKHCHMSVGHQNGHRVARVCPSVSVNPDLITDSQVLS